MVDVVEIGPCTLVHADWREWLDDQAFTAILSDPPYGDGFVKGTSGTRTVPRGDRRVVGLTATRETRPVTGNDEPFDPEPILGLGVEVLLWGADRYRTRLPPTGRFLAWDKLAGREPWDTFSDVEFAWHSVNGASRVFSMLWKGLACEKIGEDNGRRYHPTLKPVRLMIWCLDQLRDPSIVFDPYMGSGSTGVAVVRANTGRFLGVDVERRYFDVACERIAREVSNG